MIKMINIKGRTVIGPHLVTNSLVLYLDASNPKSYPGSGDIWYDLSKSGIKAELNGRPKPSFVGNAFEFNGGNSVTFNNPINQDNLEQEWTIMSIININDDDYQTILDINGGLYVCYENNSLLSLNGTYYMYGGSFANLGWVMATFRFRNSDAHRTIYKNNINVSTFGANVSSVPVGINSSLNLGSNLHGKIANLIIYDRLLSDSEILQNYNAIKQRYIN